MILAMKIPIRLSHLKWEKNIQREMIILFQTSGDENNHIGNSLDNKIMSVIMER